MTEKKTLQIRQGFYFEDFHIGETVTSPGRTITEADITTFAGLTGDWSAIHTDAVYAAGQPFGQRIAHGMLVTSIAIGMVIRLGFLEDTLLAFREIEHWKFSQPVYIGDTLSVRLTINHTKAVPRLGGGLVGLEAEVINQAGKIVQHGLCTILVKSRPDTAG